jgi:hypothetical protein
MFTENIFRTIFEIRNRQNKEFIKKFMGGVAMSGKCAKDSSPFGINQCG